MWDAKQKWYIIGIQLGLPVIDLDTIRRNHYDSRDCIIEMLSIWLTRGGATRKALICALHRKSVGFEQLADLITADSFSATYVTTDKDEAASSEKGFKHQQWKHDQQRDPANLIATDTSLSQQHIGYTN